IEMYQSDYCITLDELPADLYSKGVETKPTQSTTTTSGDGSTTTTTTTATGDFKFEVKSYDIELPANYLELEEVVVEIEGAPTASIGGALGYSNGSTPEDWVNIEWKGNADKDGKLTVTIDTSDMPKGLKNAELQIWWSNVWNAATETATDKDCEMIKYEVHANMGGLLTPVVYGDANEDGEVNISDAVLIMQSIANPEEFKITEQGKLNGDVYNTGDGITNNDALIIQYVEIKTITAADLPVDKEFLNDK
ncbi:MAG: dockerin type I repeat-containing protein, partial [Ruminococcus sp.]|nr:dockerin type I repeat-containing protein [Ruminococcus sp.]